jgi:hypothetical protein
MGCTGICHSCAAKRVVRRWSPISERAFRSCSLTELNCALGTTRTTFPARCSRSWNFLSHSQTSPISALCLGHAGRNGAVILGGIDAVLFALGLIPRSLLRLGLRWSGERMRPACCSRRLAESGSDGSGGTPKPTCETHVLPGTRTAFSAMPRDLLRGSLPFPVG